MLTQNSESAEEMTALQELVPLMIAVVRQCLHDGDEDGAISGFEIFDDLVEFVCNSRRITTDLARVHLLYRSSFLH